MTIVKSASPESGRSPRGEMQWTLSFEFDFIKGIRPPPSLRVETAVEFRF